MTGSGFEPGFLTEYWQKRHCCNPFPLTPGLPELNPDEIAWLATLPDVESRLIFTEQTGSDTTYRLENGPFDVGKLGGLPDRDWTLLVQDVDKHLPAFAAWFDMTRCIPRWRIDDLMVSVAAPGGSVGPHRDNYDVFLCQGKGHRTWRLGDPALARPAASAATLSLLEPFDAQQTIRAAPGHVLYLPPLLPHWGIAEDLCITYSIGFRAPTSGELAATTERVIRADQAQCADQTFYADPDLEPAESDDGRISHRTIQRVRRQGLVASCLTDLEIARIFGMTVTDPKPWLDPDPVSFELLDAAVSENGYCRAHGMALLAWCRDNGSLILFLNGRERILAADWQSLIRGMCRRRRWSGDEWHSALSLPDGRRELAWLGDKGLFDAR